MTNNATKIITFYFEHLNKMPKIHLQNGHRTAYQILFQDIHSNYRNWAFDALKKGYSVIFVHNDQTKILKYNA